VIYLDNNATTKASKQVVAEVTKYLEFCFSNASASTAAYTGADEPRRAAAFAMAKLLNAEGPECFHFTSGATESNNWVFSALSSWASPGPICISAVEHPSVREPAENMARLGFDVLELPVDANGVVRVDELVQLLSPETRLVSIMAANNETGVLQPIADIGRVVRSIAPLALFHTDATQAIGKIGIDLQGEWSDVDLLSFSAHKFHGPKGVGGVYWRPGIELAPLLVGGGQEDGFRSGTTNTPGLAGLAAAVNEISISTSLNLREKREYFERRLIETVPVQIHSAGAPRLPNTSCFSIAGMSGVEVASELAELGIIVGTGAACSSGSLAPSRTLTAMGVDYDVAMGALRVSLSHSTLLQELDSLISAVAEIYA
jgi:cysteine desulfurase